jgi:Flp pilus assembly pilin Flp
MKFMRNEKGQGIMEYVIISSLIGICCLVAVKNFGDKVKDRIQVMQKQVETIPSSSAFTR